MATYPVMPSVQRSQHAKAEEDCQRYERMKQVRQPYEPDWQDICRYLVPGADDILEQREPGDSRTQYIFDSHPLLAPKSLASHMDSGATNSAWQWFELAFRGQALQDSQPVNQWLEFCSQDMAAAYGASSFYQAAYTYYLNLGAFGTAAMWAGTRLRSDGRYLHFKTLPTGSYCIAEDADGLVDTLYRELWLTPRQAVQLFGGQVSAEMQRYARSAVEQDKERCFLHCVYPRTERNPRRADTRNLPYAGVYLEKDTRFVNEETGYHEFPYLVSRWETLSRAPYGFGPGHLALPDVRMLNKMRELHVTQLALWVRPPLKALREGVLGAISLESNAVNVLTQMDALAPLDLTGRPDLVQIDQEQLRRSIDDCFMVNALQALPPPQATDMTAYEVGVRISMMQQIMGPAFSRILYEFLDPLIDHTFGQRLRMGAFPPVPREVLLAARETGGQIDVVYEGPMARAQRQADAQAFDQAVILGERLVAMQQSLAVLDNVDWDAGFKDAVRIKGLPRSLIVPMADVQRKRQMQAAQAQQMQQAAEMRENLTAVGKIAPIAQQMQNGQQQRLAA